MSVADSKPRRSEKNMLEEALWKLRDDKTIKHGFDALLAQCAPLDRELLLRFVGLVVEELDPYVRPSTSTKTAAAGALAATLTLDLQQILKAVGNGSLPPEIQELMGENFKNADWSEVLGNGLDRATDLVDGVLAQPQWAHLKRQSG
jgi:hypothetical protein